MEREGVGGDELIVGQNERGVMVRDEYSKAMS